MKTIYSTNELGPKHHVEEGDQWVHPHSGETKVWQDGAWTNLPPVDEKGAEGDKDPPKPEDKDLKEVKKGSKK